METGMARYRKIYPKLWTEPDFMHLNPLAQLGILYCFCGPMSNAVGIYHCPQGVLEGAVRWSFGYCPGCEINHGGSSPDGAYNKSPFEEIMESGLVQYVQDVIWIPSWWKWNPPENENVAINLARQLDDIALGELAQPYAERVVNYLPKNMAGIILDQLRTLGHTFPNTYPTDPHKRMYKRMTGVKRSPKRSGKGKANPSPKQEQEQRTEQEQLEEADASSNTPDPALALVRGLQLYEADQKLLKRLPEMLPAWREAYPGLDIGRVIRRAHAWEVANKKRRKRDRIRFLQTWMDKEQDRSGRDNGPNRPRTTYDSIRERRREVDDALDNWAKEGTDNEPE